jgi:hypothetical protein
MERDIELPFDELDPCCQREIESRRRETAVTRELRKGDRSNERNDIISTVFTCFNRYKSCGCCKDTPADYALLSELKMLQEHEHHSAYELDNNRGEDDEEDSDDEFFRELDEPTPFEQQRLHEIKAAAERFEAAKKMGYGIHRDDSVQHIGDMIRQGQVVLCHICDTNSIICARIDLALESLARKYLGTVFRRLNNKSTFSGASDEAQRFRSEWRISDNSDANSPCLVVFSGGDLMLVTSSLDRFVDPAERYTTVGEVDVGADSQSVTVSELEKFLDQARALLLAPPSWMGMESTSILRSIRAEDGEDDDGEDGRPTSSYCGHPGCERNFPHEHVGESRGSGDSAGRSEAGSGSSATRIGTLLGAQMDKASEALAKDWHKV